MFYFLIAFVLVSVVQSFLHQLQMKKVNLFFYDLRERGNVLVGMKRNMFRKSAILMMLLNQNNVEEAYVVYGRSTLSKIKPYPEIQGKNIFEAGIPHNKTIALALKNAIDKLQSSIE